MIETKLRNKKKGQRGQLVLEYILLLLVAVSMASLLRNTLTASTGDAQSSGVFIKMWTTVVQTIGEDYPVDPEAP